MLEYGMNYEDPAITQFKRLVAQHGVDTVAVTIGASSEYLKQIVAGYKLPSGQPRGVGPKLRKSLSAHYPGWDAPTSKVARVVSVGVVAGLQQALDVMATSLQAVPKERLDAVAEVFAGWIRSGGAEQWRPIVEAVMASSEKRPAQAVG